ncbi:MAG: hypothetical protein B6U72_06145 [Candidatus Altiarchaeales archaeon ex4484_2]|nr:MAG: hypothetical protein B6U72_06145 [Candidatus Altiarchaeales archaeon ex4484_2]
MKKTILALAVACLLSSAYASNNNAMLDYKFYDNMLEDYLLKRFCEGVKRGERCNVAEPLKDNIRGVCCDGKCKREVSNCREEQPPDLEPVANIVKEMLCFSKEQNEKCIISDRGNTLEGRCCDSMCYFGIRDCDEIISEPIFDKIKPGTEIGHVEPEPKPAYAEDTVSVSDLQERIEVLSCLGIPDNKRCEIPAEIADEYNLYGVCCSQKCAFRVDECQNEPVTDDKNKGDDSSIIILLLAGFIIILFFIVLMLLIQRFLRGKNKTESLLPPPSEDYGMELKRLQDEKKSVEEMMKLAQFKFRKRKLDEESFREIVRDQQKRLIEIEARINEMENRVTVLEEKQKT